MDQSQVGPTVEASIHYFGEMPDEKPTFHAQEHKRDNWRPDIRPITFHDARGMVYVAAEWEGKLPAKQSDEKQMLEFCPHVQPNSRLTCQIPVTDALDGLTVKIPPSQH